MTDIKQDIRLYDFEFNLVYIISDWISVNWELCYNRTGTFEIHLPFYSQLIKALDEHMYLVAVQGDKQAIITGKRFEDEIIIYGRTPNWLLGKRFIQPFTSIHNTTYEAIIRKKLSEVFDSSDNFTQGSPLGDFETIEQYQQKKLKSALDLITESLDSQQAGHRLTFIPLEHKWLFEIYRGEERDIILSQANKNAHSPVLTQDILTLSNGLYYKDEETDSYGVIPSDKQGMYRWYALAQADNEGEAQDELTTLKTNRILTFDTTDILYGQDYNLGDIVSVETDFGDCKIRQKKRITGVRIWDEHLNHGESPIFEEKEAK